ncbi:hypothetical protein TNIN_299691 [Trichonephila inaurata madagascariensis]|uniref:Uncharacterized protein n=1 Tax=Trichonephila inaurata madagascariensis TaxID=2747483 RepID=A0A8X6X5H6_9ARAC|nr:hypothetical protein TNIN_299691 [Trichonephila inaurata madagascariensis]
MTGSQDDAPVRACIDPSMELMRVSFDFDLKSTANKQTHHEDLLRQLALGIISCIPKDAVKVYTNGIRTADCTCSSIFTRTHS